MSIKKNYLDNSTFCKVTFKLPNNMAHSTKQACIVGEFNNWDPNSLPMKKQKNGEFTTSLNLEKGKTYQFKYLIDHKEWINDLDADSYAINEFQGENSVVTI